MLGIMVSQTALRNGAVTTGCTHYAEFLPFIEDPSWENRPANLCTRRKTVSETMPSYSYSEDINMQNVVAEQPVLDDIGQRKPLLLLSTALSKHFQTTGENADFIEEKMKVYFESLNEEYKGGNMTQKQIVMEIMVIKCAIAESRLYQEWSESGNVGPYSQFSNMDYLFSSLFWVFKIFKVTKYTEYIRVLLCLNRIMSKGTDRDKTSNMVKTSNMARVAEAFPLISNCKDIHLPPFVFNFKRLGDLVSVLAGVHVSDPTTFLETFGSPKYLLHMRSDGTDNLDSLIRLWKLESKEAENKNIDECFYHSLSSFHQILIKKDNIFCNSQKVKGNALKVTLQVV